MQAIAAPGRKRRVQLHARGIQVRPFPLAQDPTFGVQEPDLDLRGFFTFGVPHPEGKLREGQGKAQRFGHTVDFQRFDSHAKSSQRQESSQWMTGFSPSKRMGSHT